MAKDGMKRCVYFASDPTYEAVLGKFNREYREAKEKQEAMKPWRLIATIHKLARVAGYKICGDLIIRDAKSGDVFKSRHVDRGYGGR